MIYVTTINDKGRPSLPIENPSRENPETRHNPTKHRSFILNSWEAVDLFSAIEECKFSLAPLSLSNQTG